MSAENAPEQVTKQHCGGEHVLWQGAIIGLSTTLLLLAAASLILV